MHIKRIMENWRRYTLTEGRLEKALAKVPDNLKDDLQKVADNDPAGNLKYLGWAAKQLKKGAPTSSLIDAIDGFHKNKQRLDKKDIYQYSFEELDSTLSDLGLSKTKKKEKKKEEGTIRIHEDDRFLSLAPITTEGSCIYGAGTKWCISAQNSDNMFRQYFHDDGVVFVFIVDKQKDPEDPTHKIALVYYPEVVKKLEKRYSIEGKLKLDGGVPLEIYNAEDKLECKSQNIDDLFRISVTPPQGQSRQGEKEEMKKIKEYLDSSLQYCESYLEEYFDGKWPEFKKKFLKVVEKIDDKKNEYDREERREKAKALNDLIDEYSRYRTDNDKAIVIDKVVAKHWRRGARQIMSVHEDMFNNPDEVEFILFYVENKKGTHLDKLRINTSREMLRKVKIKHILEFVPPYDWYDTIEGMVEKYLETDIDAKEITIDQYNVVMMASIREERGEEAVNKLEPDFFSRIVIDDIYRNFPMLKDAIQTGEFARKAIERHIRLHNIEGKRSEWRALARRRDSENYKVIGIGTELDGYYNSSFDEKFDDVRNRLRRANDIAEFLNDYAKNYINWDNPLIVDS